MGGKKGPSAKDRAAEKARHAKEKASQAKEDADWAAAGEGKRTKAQAKRAAKEDDRQDAAQKKAEARRMADEEAAAALSSSKKPAAPRKITKYELEKQAEMEKERNKQLMDEKDKLVRREVDENAYSQLVDRKVDNLGTEVDARNVDQALAQLGLNEKPKMKYSQFLEREMPLLKTEKPGLKAPQYKDIIWKKWLRSPENPLNQK